MGTDASAGTRPPLEARTSARPPNLELLALALPEYGALFDQTLAHARDQIGPDCDPANLAHARILRTWLNGWLSRIAYPQPGATDVFADSLASWWGTARDQLPAGGVPLSALDDAQLQAIADAYASLVDRTADQSRKGRRRSFAPTATAKLLYFIRPDAVTTWDKAISQHVHGRGRGKFLNYLVVCRSWAVALEREAGLAGNAGTPVGAKRPRSSTAKLIDEWLYMTITRGISPVAG